MVGPHRITVTSVHIVGVFIIISVSRVAGFCSELEVRQTIYYPELEGLYKIMPTEEWCLNIDESKPSFQLVQEDGPASMYIYYGHYYDEQAREEWYGWTIGNVSCSSNQVHLRAKVVQPSPEMVEHGQWYELISGGLEIQSSALLQCLKCEKGYWGDCLSECYPCYHGSCNQTNGQCECAFGYESEDCNTMTLEARLGIGLGVAGLVIIIIIVNAVWCWKGCRRKKGKSGTMKGPTVSTANAGDNGHFESGPYESRSPRHYNKYTVDGYPSSPSHSRERHEPSPSRSKSPRHPDQFKAPGPLYSETMPEEYPTGAAENLIQGQSMHSRIPRIDDPGVHNAGHI